MKIEIICVGKIKEKYFNEAIKQYQNRLNHFCKITIIEIQAETKLDDATLVQEVESQKILRKIDPKSFIFLFDRSGKETTSIEFAQKINQTWQTHPKITFIIGGSHGIDQLILNQINEKISFGKVTYPHKLFRVIALEQIYRAFQINTNTKYHK